MLHAECALNNKHYELIDMCEISQSSGNLNRQKDFSLALFI